MRLPYVLDIRKTQVMIKKVETLLKHRPLMFVVVLLSSLVLLLSPILLGEVGTTKDGAILGFLKENAWSDFLGVFHPLVLHLPIGALILIFSMELLGKMSPKYRFDMTIPLLFNAGSSVLAVVLGLLWYYGGDDFSSASELLDSHMWKGLIYAVCALWLPLIYAAGRGRLRIFYYLTLIGSVVMMTVSAHDGGESLHGDIFTKAPWNLKEDSVRERSGDGDGTEVVASVYDPVLFTEIVTPILEEKCNSCHHSDHKVKSDLKFDTYADILKGGREQDYYPCLVPGDVENSFLVGCIELPDDDDFHMPPIKKDQITAEELVLLKWWVSVGAPEEKKLSEVEVPAEVQAILDKQKK